MTHFAVSEDMYYRPACDAMRGQYFTESVVRGIFSQEITFDRLAVTCEKCIETKEYQSDIATRFEKISDII